MFVLDIQREQGGGYWREYHGVAGAGQRGLWAVADLHSVPQQQEVPQCSTQERHIISSNIQYFKKLKTAVQYLNIFVYSWIKKGEG